jgi:hypothetical protein
MYLPRALLISCFELHPNVNCIAGGIGFKIVIKWGEVDTFISIVQRMTQ